MATKGTNAKIKELKGVKAEKITNEQLEKLQALVRDVNMMHHEVGVIESKKHSLIHDMAAQQNVLIAMQDEFTKEYGTYDININNGTINYKEDGKADKKD
jgi:hypothetical protein